MQDFLNYIIKHWPELAAAIGIGGGSGFAAKKLTDKNQDKKISYLETKVDSMDKQLTQLKNDINTNTLFDKQFREQMEKEYSIIKDDIREVKGNLKQILGHLLSKS